ncbi:hypothetical protein GCM10009675_49870 [Prauserella alba]|uniref:Uncharacterized protein n=1 Tax=Prauserella alba TaxID=176898 RepID=A0ABN1VV91_9PSEU
MRSVVPGSVVVGPAVFVGAVVWVGAGSGDGREGAVDLGGASALVAVGSAGVFGTRITAAISHNTVVTTTARRGCCRERNHRRTGLRRNSAMTATTIDASMKNANSVSTPTTPGPSPRRPRAPARPGA